MNYGKVIRGEFISRPNRFIAHVNIGGEETVVHVKNTGRCRELLLPGAEVYLEEASNPNRKTKYDLIAVRKSNGVLFNIDSQAPNAVVKEWLERQNIARIVPEYRYGDSRIDFFLENETEDWKMLIEVKGCTLERGGIGYFPDAPTERGVRHLHELMKARKEGYDAAIAFVMQADGMKKVLPNDETHPAFGKALREAQAAGVKVLYLPCHVEPDSLEIGET
ncbi:MAG: DNA/RNA nuclease SfsA [Eubacterium sp.]|jgi:sugar fermentation stimulation protein A|nr:DNA/RNA nuclease SfsA [Eubacterium sp.]MCH4047216.1 DNA/RNA nuclease SfsA [Eubacterium sp.]MCH4080313.1 DNA/RNA nuclease SfsA [Eubacterium sp.]MCH4110872.1 DNA/RNA nuclease SfsA [Eubacterium sp.]MCI1307287.1 DNA/RNA nuclease SfsA [Eubacterium sp.]